MRNRLFTTHNTVEKAQKGLITLENLQAAVADLQSRTGGLRNEPKIYSYSSNTAYSGMLPSEVVNTGYFAEVVS